MTDKVKMCPIQDCKGNVITVFDGIHDENEICNACGAYFEYGWDKSPIEDKLKEYAQHKEGCMSKVKEYMTKHPLKCTCGLEELL